MSPAADVDVLAAPVGFVVVVSVVVACMLGLVCVFPETLVGAADSVPRPPDADSGGPPSITVAVHPCGDIGVCSRV